MELAALLEQAQSAPRDRRIEWRDPIPAHRATPIEGVRPRVPGGGRAGRGVGPGRPRARAFPPGLPPPDAVIDAASREPFAA